MGLSKSDPIFGSIKTRTKQTYKKKTHKGNGRCFTYLIHRRHIKKKQTNQKKRKQNYTALARRCTNEKHQRINKRNESRLESSYIYNKAAAVCDTYTPIVVISAVACNVQEPRSQTATTDRRRSGRERVHTAHTLDA